MSTVLTTAATDPSATGPAGHRRPLVLGPRPAAVLPGRRVPDFDTIRVGRSRMRHRVRVALRRRRLLLLCLAVLAVAAAVPALPGIPDDLAAPHGHPKTQRQAQGRTHTHASVAARRVLVPVRVADAATVRLLRPGDRVDVIAAEPDAGEARAVARGARVQKVPARDGPAGGGADGTGGGGALVVLKVPRATATELAGAASHARLSVTLW